MNRRLDSCLTLLMMVLAGALAWGQVPAKAASPRKTVKGEDFASAIKRIRETWVQEFNAGHADKVAALYADEAVLMRRNGSLHNRDSIQADLQRSITTAEARNYIIQSLHSESSGDLGYDTGMYNEDVRSHVAEGNYLIVLKRIDGEWKIVAHAAVPNPRQK
jgi:ketosteroid isomerase-like protein